MSSNPGLNYKEIGFISISIQVDLKIYNEKDCDLVITNCMVFTGKNGLPIPQDKEEELKLENFEDYDILKILDNKSSNFTEFLKGKSIEIQVDSKSMTTFKKFTKENSLSDIRNEFKKNHRNDILIEDFMVFMKDKSQIPPDEESNVKLEQFMDSGTIVIKVESLKELPKCNHLIKKFYLKHGLKKMNDSIEILKKAIKFHCKTKEETKKGK
ncbi:22364_t:CDS:2, partial [Gigaspora rosea]